MRTLCLSAVAASIAFLSPPLIAAAAQVPPLREPIVSVPPDPVRMIATVDATTGEPIAGVEILEIATSFSVLTSSTGSANLAVVIPDGGKIRLRKLGFEQQIMTIAMGPADTSAITVRMKRVVELPAVVTKDAAPKYLSPLLRGFEERRKNATAGHFIDEAALRNDDKRPLASVLASNVPGSIIMPLGSANFLVKSRRCSTGGQPDVYVDGVLLAHVMDSRWPRPPSSMDRGARPPDETQYPFDLNQFQAVNLAGIEYYADNTGVPQQFSRGRGCGALFLWTRER